MKIKKLTIVTQQGVKEYQSEDKQIIVESDYHVNGDPYTCYKVVNNGSVISEIRCVHLLEIEYYTDGS